MLIHFYEKPGCINNTRQKRLLEQHGHRVEAHSLLDQKWDAATLRLFFNDMPVSQWFNVSAPCIKSGEIVPENFDENSALLAMIKDPLLIRRPLIDVYGELVCGFDNPLVKSLLSENTDISNLQSCPNIATGNKCD